MALRITLDKDTSDGLRNDLVDVIIALQNDPLTAMAINDKINRLPTKKRVDIQELIRMRRSDNTDVMGNPSKISKMSFSQSHTQVNFSFSITGFEIIILLAGLIVGVLQLPNFGLRVSNVLREKFKLGHESQLRLIRAIDLIGTVAPMAMGSLVAINGILDEQSSRVVENVVRGTNKGTWKNPFKLREWVSSLNGLYKNPTTKGSVIKAIKDLDNPFDKYVAKFVLQALGHSVNFSESNEYDPYSGADYINYARVIVSRSMSNFGDGNNLEYTKRKVTALDVLRVIVHIIVNMLANPGVALVIAAILRRTLSYSLMTELLVAAGIGGGAKIAKTILDKIQRIKDATYGTV